jgi:hypothetical protein
MQAGLTVLEVLLTQAAPPADGYAALFDQIVIQYRRELELGYFHGDTLEMLKVYTLNLLAAHLAKREAEAAKEPVIHPANPPPEALDAA